MKQFKSTGVLFVLVLAVVGYAYFFEYRGKQQSEAQQLENKKIIPFSLNETVEMSVKTFAEEYLFKKNVETSKWILEKPVNDVASSILMQDYLSQFGQEVYEEVIAEGDGINYDIYGLNDKDPKNKITTITFKTKDKSIVIDIGSAVATAGKKYLRINKENRVLLGGYFWESQFQQSLSELREKSFVPSDFSISKIEIKNKDLISFELKDGKWILPQLQNKDLDQTGVDDIHYQIKNLRATQIFKEGKNPQDLQHLGLTEPEIKIDIYSATNEKLEFLFSKNMAGQVYAISSNRNLIFSLSPQSMKVFSKELEDFRDKKKPLSFDLTDVGEIDYKSSLISFTLIKQNNVWTSKEKLENREVDNSKVVDILSKLSSMKVKKYLDQEIAYQKSGSSELTLKKTNGEKILELEWSGRPVEDFFVAKSNLYEKPFSLSMQDVSSLPFQAVIIDKNSNSSKEKLTQ